MLKSRRPAQKKKISNLGNMDVVFIIDSTGSMQPYITEAKTYARAVMERIESDNDLSIKAAIVAYRDHPPQDLTFVTEVFDFNSKKKFQKSLNSLDAAGGGDEPEAVYDALYALSELSWRKNSDRIAYLIGDAPPHEPCACGITKEQIKALFKTLKVELNAHSIANSQDTTAAFKEFVDATGGKLSLGDRARDTTLFYSGSLLNHSVMITNARAFVNTTISTLGAWSGSAMSDTCTYSIGKSLGWSPAETQTVVNYLNHRMGTDL